MTGYNKMVLGSGSSSIFKIADDRIIESLLCGNLHTTTINNFNDSDMKYYDSDMTYYDQAIEIFGHHENAFVSTVTFLGIL